MTPLKYLSFTIAFVLSLTSCIERGEAAMQVTSPAFLNQSPIPAKYTCQGEDVNPPLEISDVPPTAKSIVLIVDDPDAPMGTWVHWTVYNISPESISIPEDSIPGEQGWNSFERNDWGGPCPPSGTHRYYFKLYALDKDLSPLGKMTKNDIEGLMAGHILAQAQCMGTYKKR